MNGPHRATGAIAATVPLLVPRRADHGERDRLWEFARTRWPAKEYTIYEGHHDAGPFNRSAALNTAARAAGTWDIAVIADADILIDRRQLRRAVHTSRRTGRITYAFSTFRALTAAGTEKILAGYSGSWHPLVHWSQVGSPSSCFAVPRALWDEVGGFDERFRGWGWEDIAFQLACATLAGGVDRIVGDVWHLFHPYSPHRDTNDPDQAAAKALADRYIAAKHKPDAMRALLSERVAA